MENYDDALVHAVDVLPHHQALQCVSHQHGVRVVEEVALCQHELRVVDHELAVVQVGADR